MDKERYKKIQLELYKSHESLNAHWKEGQRKFIKEWMTQYPKDSVILDIACGDGCGLEMFKELGYEEVWGFEWSKDKAQKARAHYNLVCGGCDMHELSCEYEELTDFDVVYSSHTIEHALNPAKVFQEIKKVLKDNGEFVMVLPYPDPSDGNKEAHCGKYTLGTNLDDDAKKLEQFVYDNGFIIIEKKYDDFREPEVWLRMKKRM